MTPLHKGDATGIENTCCSSNRSTESILYRPRFNTVPRNVTSPNLRLKPITIDLFCGLGGWAEGFLAEGYEVIGFDIERHDYGTGGYPAQLVLQDVLTLDGSQFKDATVIVASPPCQAYSYMAMPWTRAKAMAREIRASQIKWAKLNELFAACFRIAAEAGVPLIVENVRGAQRWVGPARWHYGSFYLWGDVPALMPITRHQKVPHFRFDGSGGSFQTAAVKVPGLNWNGSDKPGYVARAFNTTAEQSIKVNDAINLGMRLHDGQWSHSFADDIKGIPHEPTSDWTNPAENGSKCGADNEYTSWFNDKGPGAATSTARFGSKSKSRKAASAQIAKIPFPLARHIARCFKSSLEQQEADHA